MSFSIRKLRSDKINGFYLIHRDGFTIFHREYISSKMDENLLSGFMTAIFNISEELSIKSINVMDMDDTKFIYDRFMEYILILNADKKVDLNLGKDILSKIIKSFEQVFKDFDESIKSDYNELSNQLRTIQFENQIDSAIDEVLRDYFNNTPSMVLDEIEAFLHNLFGTLGKNMLEWAIKKVVRNKDLFKREQLEELVLFLEESLIRKTSENQGKQIVQQIKDVFLSKN